jgi:hypothetical protein
MADKPWKCPKCGALNAEYRADCYHCRELREGFRAQRPPSPSITGPIARDVPTYLAQAILVTLFCFWPTGIPAIVNAARVNSKLVRGDYAGALEASRKAKMWCWISLGVGVAVIVVYAIIIGVVGLPDY